jgi:hypothetical protein
MKAGPIMLAVLVVNIVLGVVPIQNAFLRNSNAQITPGPGPAWFNESFDYRVPLEVKPFDFAAVNHPVEVELNLTPIVGGNFRLDSTSLFLAEYTSLIENGMPIQKRQSNDPLVADSVPFRQYNDTHIDAKSTKFTLAWLLDGTTTTARYYFLYFSNEREKDLGLRSPDDPKTFGMIDSNYWIQRGMVFYGYNPGEEIDWPNLDEIEVIDFAEDLLGGAIGHSLILLNLPVCLNRIRHTFSLQL